VLKFFKTLCLSLMVGLFAANIAHADQFGTRDEAKALAEKAVAFIKAEGKDKAIAEFGNPQGKFIDRDLYIVLYAADGMRLAHPHNPKLVGKSAAEAKDFDGKPYGQELIDTAKKGSGWVDYKFTDPTTKKLEDKSAYVLSAGDLFVVCGVYKH